MQKLHILIPSLLMYRDYASLRGTVLRMSSGKYFPAKVSSASGQDSAIRSAAMAQAIANFASSHTKAADAQARRPLKILGLHGGYQNGPIFHTLRTKDFRRRLAAELELTCLSAPILAEANEDPLLERRSWFDWDEHDPLKFEEYLLKEETHYWKT